MSGAKCTLLADRDKFSFCSSFVAGLSLVYVYVYMFCKYCRKKTQRAFLIPVDLGMVRKILAVFSQKRKCSWAGFRREQLGESSQTMVWSGVSCAGPGARWSLCVPSNSGYSTILWSSSHWPLGFLWLLFWCVHSFCFFSINCDPLCRILAKSRREVKEDNKSGTNFLQYCLDNAFMGTLSWQSLK